MPCPPGRIAHSQSPHVKILTQGKVGTDARAQYICMQSVSTVTEPGICELRIALGQNASCLRPLFSAGFMSPYAQEYKRSYLSVPWAIFTVCLNESFEYAPWLSLLPPEAQRSLHTWGRCIFSQTALCKRGSVSIDRYGDWLRDASSLRQRTSPADTLAKCCAAFAHSPLSLAIDLRAAVQCVSLALKEVHGTEQGRMVLPSYVEHQLDCVCAAGCGGDLSTGFTCMGRYSHQVKYCSDKCAQTVSQALTHLAYHVCFAYVFLLLARPVSALHV